MREESSTYDKLISASSCHNNNKKGCAAFTPYIYECGHLVPRVVLRRKTTCIWLLLSITMTCAIMSLVVLTLCLSCPLLTAASPVGSDRGAWEEEPRDIDYQEENELSSKFIAYNAPYKFRNDLKQDIKDTRSEIERLNSFENSDDYDSIAQNKESPRRRLPDAIIIGVKKAGTRALLEFLRIHPDVRAPGPEPHFFDRYYDRGYEWYRRQMPASMDGQLTMEKTPSYFITKEAPGRIRKMNPHIKLILVVRDPVTRAISDYTQALSKRDDVKPFEDMAFVDNATGIVDVSWGAIKIGIYAKHFDRWQVHFPPSQIHIVNGEKLIEEPAKEMARVQSFLGLKTVINDKHFYFNATKGFPCLKKPEHSGNPHCLGRTKGRPHPEINPLAVQRLKAFFKPFNQKFYQMVGEDFGWN